MFQLRNTKGVTKIIGTLIFIFGIAQAQTVASCWDPSTGTQKTCVDGVTDGFCQTNLTTGVGSCVSSSSSTDPKSLYCNSNDNCNQIFTQCYNPIGRAFVTCDQTGLNTYCQLSLAGPIIKIDQFKYASGSCQSACTPSNTNDVAITVCCFAQNNCNNVFGLGPHHNGGHSTERGVNGTRKFGGRPESTGKPRSTIKPSTIRG